MRGLKKRTGPDPRTGRHGVVDRLLEMDRERFEFEPRSITVCESSGFSAGDLITLPRTGEVMRVASVDYSQFQQPSAVRVAPLGRLERWVRWARVHGRDWAEGVVTRLSWVAVGSGLGALVWGAL